MDLSNFRKNSDDMDETWDDWLGQNDSKSKEQKKGDADSRALDDFGLRSGEKTALQRKPTVKKPQREAEDDTAISIEIRMPHVRIPKPHIPWRRLRPWGITAAVVLVLLLGGKFLVEHTLPKKKAPTTPSSVQAVLDLGYKPILPVKSDGTKTPTLTRNPEKNVYSFYDTYLDSNLTVDQQALPKNFRGNAQAIEDLASSLQAKDSFTTTIGTAHIYTDEKSGAQRLFVYNDKMLMFIQSTKTIDDASWVEYIQSMQ
ncbi:hypothetical protein KDA14_04775 [Candidatus Saccharibacteria bacterium]|nr:hypothetical protein [Candidatus Saccharibacteria bacterium]